MNGLKEDGCEQQLESGLLPSRLGLRIFVHDKRHSKRNEKASTAKARNINLHI